ncbi:olfactory receptor 5V1-like [Lissotriton helveticus]
MKEENLSLEEQEVFLIVGFSDFPHLQVLLFVTFFLIYLVTLIGNLLIMTTIYSNVHLHTPMYFFITNLSLIEITYSSIIFLPMLSHFFLVENRVSLTECLLQMHFFMVMVSIEILLLTVMAYDRYVAICNPLRYSKLMNMGVCFWLAVGCWVFGLIIPAAHTILLSTFSFCESHRINHFFCDVTALMKISCSNSYSFEVLTYTIGAIVVILSFVLLSISYINIVSSILKIKSIGGRHKAFSTCASHLAIVILFYGSVCSTYIRPASTYSVKDNKIMSLSYIAVAPLCNPIIYSLKNKEFVNALRKTKSES